MRESGQPAKARFPTVATEVGSHTSASAAPSKARSPTARRPSGSTTDVRLEQPAKAASPMARTLAGKVTDWMETRSWNPPGSIALTR